MGHPVLENFPKPRKEVSIMDDPLSKYFLPFHNFFPLPKLPCFSIQATDNLDTKDEHDAIDNQCSTDGQVEKNTL